MAAALVPLQEVSDGVVEIERGHEEVEGAQCARQMRGKERSGIRERSASVDSVVCASQVTLFAVATRGRC
jgi:hypothetical protein